MATAVVAGLTWGIARQRTSQIDPGQVIAVNLTAARLAIEDDRLVQPPEHSAAYYYRMVLAIDPTNEAARAGLDSISEQLLEIAKQSILQQRFANAVQALDDVRRIAPSHRRIPFVETELRRALEELAAPVRAQLQSSVPVQAAITPTPAPTQAPAEPRVMKQLSPREAAPANIQAIEAEALASSAAALSSTAVRAESLAEPVAGSAPAAIQWDPATEATTSTQQAQADSRESEVVSAAVVPQAPQLESGNATEPEPLSVTAPRIEPKIVRMVSPDYPDSARDRGIQGWVDLTLVVAPTGEVLDARIDGRDGAKSFERAALAAVRKWKYERSGSSVPLNVPVRVAFKLEE